MKNKNVLNIFNIVPLMTILTISIVNLIMEPLSSSLVLLFIMLMELTLFIASSILLTKYSNNINDILYTEDTVEFVYLTSTIIGLLLYFIVNFTYDITVLPTVVISFIINIDRMLYIIWYTRLVK